MQFIGICGKDRAGKDSLAAAIGGQILPFAGELKRIVGELYALTPAQLHDPVQKGIVDPLWDLSPRQILRAVGTEVARSVHPDTWVRAWDRQVDALLRRDGCPPERLIAPDVRFDNEAAAIRARGGKIVRVVRPLAEGADSPKDPEGVPQRRVSDHASNRDDIKPDLVVVNDGSLDDLWRTGLWIGGLFAPPSHGRSAPLPWRVASAESGTPLAGRHPPQEATIGDFAGGDGVRFTLDHRPTCHRRGPWHLLIEVAERNHEWGCFDDQDQPSRWYHSQDAAQEEARLLAAVLLKDRWGWAT